MIDQLAVIIAGTLLLSVVFMIFFSVAASLSLSGLTASSFFLFAGIAVIIIFAAFFIGNAWYVRAYIRSYYYDAGESFITIRKGVFAPTEIHVQYQKIQDVYVDQDIVDRLMGLYDVHIASATMSSGIEAHIDGVERETAEAIKTFFLGSIQGKNMTGSGGIGASPVQVSPVPVVTRTHFSFGEEISSRVFPIDGRWIFMKAVSGVTHLAWSIFLFAYIFLLPGKGSTESLADTLGWGYGTVFSIAIFAGGLMILLRVTYFLLWKKQYFFEFLPDYIVVREGVLSRREQHIPYTSIQDVIVQQGFVERLFGLSNVLIQNAGNNQIMSLNTQGMMPLSGMEIPGQSAGHSDRISQALKSTVLSASIVNSNGL